MPKAKRARPVPPARQRKAAAPSSDRPNGHLDFPVACLGASAGGLDAFRRFFAALPAKSGIAYVLIQHLDPKHDSLMAELLAGHTSMPVTQAADGMPVERDHVYLIPPRVYLSVRAGRLRLSEPRERHGARMPVDFFLHALAEECGERAICAILSGTGADGSVGLLSVKAKGGLVAAQDPDEAAFDGMPRSAIKTGAVDLVLPVAGLAESLARAVRSDGKRMLERLAQPHAERDWLGGIIELLRTQTSHSFSLYKQGTLLRRIERRMAMAGIDNGNRYLEILRGSPAELQLLSKDLIIGVTSFFRDGTAFEALATTIVPDLVRRHAHDRPLRVWVPGCSTGEETYSIAMTFLEAIAAVPPRASGGPRLQVFGSDIDDDAVAFARNGLYPESIAADIAPERLQRFFVREDNGYRAERQLRESVVFTVQDLLSDAPFSRLDLVSCRNLLIYLRPEVQEKVLSLFHFALSDGGVLFLGTSETVGSLTNRFEPIDKKQRIFRRVGRSRPGEVDFPITGSGDGRAHWSRSGRRTAPQRPNLGDLSQRLLLDAYAPASVLINRKHEGLYYFGPTDRYLQVAAGDASRDLLAMARDGLRPKLRAVINKARETHARAVVTGATVSRNGETALATIGAQPVESDGEELILVSFLDEPERKERAESPAEPGIEATQIGQLEHELDTTRKELENAIRDLEASNEELKSINEEAMSVNEEFQSTNEELETSKEELHSLNEELTALNTQLQETVEQQRATSNDLQNILISSDVATLFLDGKLCIRFFTPAAKPLFSVVDSDIGRPLADLTHRFGSSDLLAAARAVVAGGTPLSRELQASDGAFYLHRILPYRTQDGRTEGVIFTFTDISVAKAAERKIEAARAYSDRIIDTISQPLVVLDGKLRVVFASGAFCRAFAVAPGEAIGQPLGLIGDRRLDVQALRGFLDLIRADDAAVEDYEIEIDVREQGRRTLLLSARNVRDELLAERKILVAIDDISERKRLGEAVEAAKQQAERANLAKSRFLAAASHDLRQPLQTFSLLQGILAKKVKDKEALELIARLDETLDAMSGMLNTLLDINQLEAGIVRPRKVDFPIASLLDTMRTEFGYHTQSKGLGWRVAASSLVVSSDPRLLEQMLRNLLSNAVKYTQAGKILLGCRRRGDRVRIEVWDTGTGIPTDHLGAIFEEFHQLENPARERSRGLGLGLSIVQRLGSLLGHVIIVRSRPGKGSVFAVEVPLKNGEARQPEHARPDRTERRAGRVGTVLIVEDDPEVREMLQLLLQAEGHRTAVAAHGAEALDLVGRGAFRPDFVLADFNLPGGMTGLQVVEELRIMLKRRIPTIILTGDISIATLREITQLGCLQRNKPVKAEELTRLIREMLDDAPPAMPQALPVPRQVDPESGAGQPTVFVIDDDVAVLDAMQRLLQDAGRAVEVFASGEAFLSAYKPGRDCCLVVDVRMPGIDGLALLERLNEMGDVPPTIMITEYGDIPTAVRAMKAGALDFVEKPIRPDALLASVARVLEMSRDTAQLAAWRKTAATRITALTKRERQVMDLVVTGNPNKEIAALLGVSQRTVESHRAAVMKKIGARSLSELIHMTLMAAPADAWQSMY